MLSMGFPTDQDAGVAPWKDASSLQISLEGGLNSPLYQIRVVGHPKPEGRRIYQPLIQFAETGSLMPHFRN